MPDGKSAHEAAREAALEMTRFIWAPVVGAGALIIAFSNIVAGANDPDYALHALFWPLVLTGVGLISALAAYYFRIEERRQHWLVLSFMAEPDATGDSRLGRVARRIADRAVRRRARAAFLAGALFAVAAFHLFLAVGGSLIAHRIGLARLQPVPTTGQALEAARITHAAPAPAPSPSPTPAPPAGGPSGSPGG